MSQDERLIELESKIAHQEHSLQTLGEELYLQQQKLEQLETTCNFLAEQLKTQAGSASAINTGDEKPPHY
jgi:SlyX protein